MEIFYCTKLVKLLNYKLKVCATTVFVCLLTFIQQEKTFTLIMVNLVSWDEFSKQAEELYLADPLKVLVRIMNVPHENLLLLFKMTVLFFCIVHSLSFVQTSATFDSGPRYF